MRALILASLLGWMSPAIGGDQQDPVVATVGDAEITQSQVFTALHRQTQPDASPSEAEVQAVIDSLIDEELLFQTALEEGYLRDPKVKKVLVNAYLRNKVYGEVSNSDFTDRELRAYYEANQEQFIVPEKIQLKRILVRLDGHVSVSEANDLIQQARSRLDAGESFAEVAREFSQGPYRRRGGDVGYVGRDGKPGLDIGVVERAFALEIGQLSETIETHEGYNILLVNNRREQVVRTFEQMKGSVLRKMKNERYKLEFDSHIKSIKKKAPPVHVEQNAVQSLQQGFPSSDRPIIREAPLGAPLPGSTP